MSHVLYSSFFSRLNVIYVLRVTWSRFTIQWKDCERFDAIANNLRWHTHDRVKESLSLSMERQRLVFESAISIENKVKYETANELSTCMIVVFFSLIMCVSVRVLPANLFLQTDRPRQETFGWEMITSTSHTAQRWNENAAATSNWLFFFRSECIHTRV